MCVLFCFCFVTSILQIRSSPPHPPHPCLPRHITSRNVFVVVVVVAGASREIANAAASLLNC